MKFKKYVLLWGIGFVVFLLFVSVLIPKVVIGDSTIEPNSNSQIDKQNLFDMSVVSCYDNPLTRIGLIKLQLVDFKPDDNNQVYDYQSSHSDINQLYAKIRKYTFFGISSGDIIFDHGSIKCS